MHIPKLLAVKNATNATTDRNAKGDDTNGIAAVAARPSPMHHGKHLAAETFANTTAPANAAAVFAIKYTVGPMPARSTSTLKTFFRYSGIATENPTSAPTENSMPTVIASTYGSFSIARHPVKVVGLTSV